jgi:SNF2 family DNA or RNA helicase
MTNGYCWKCKDAAIIGEASVFKGQMSTKVKAVFDIVDQIEGQYTDGEEDKVVIYSQFTSMLDVLEPFLKQRGTKYVRCELLIFEYVFPLSSP